MVEEIKIRIDLSVNGYVKGIMVGAASCAATMAVNAYIAKNKIEKAVDPFNLDRFRENAPISKVAEDAYNLYKSFSKQDIGFSLAVCGAIGILAGSGSVLIDEILG